MSDAWEGKGDEVRQRAEERNRASNLETAATLRALGECIVSMADALEADDGIMGALAGEGIANLLPELPKHVRDVFMEHLDDEAARGVRADRLYWATVH